MVVIADLNMTGNRHFNFNYSFIKILLKIYKSGIFFGDKEQYELFLKKNLEDFKSLKNKSLNLNDSSRSLKIWREFTNIFRLINILNFQKKNKIENLYLLSISPFIYYIYKKVNKLYKNQNIYIIFHGELEGIVKKEKKIWKMNYWFKKAYFLKETSNTYYILLSKIIYNNINSEMVNNNKNFLIIDHPYEFENNFSKQKQRKNKLIIGALGVARKYQKNTHLIFKLAEDLKKYIEKGSLELRIIGKISNDIIPYLNKDVIYSDDCNLLNEKEYEEKIKEIDYSIYFYEKNSYKFTCSGALIDSIKFEKPMLAYKNDFFSYYFDEVGQMGYLLNSYDELKEKIIELIENKNINEYHFFQNNLKNGKEFFSEERVLKMLNKQIENKEENESSIYIA